MKSLKLSKSAILKGMQCQKALYLSKTHPTLADEISARQQAVFDRGTSVGLRAQQLFPGGVNPSTQLPRNFNKSLVDTQRLIREGTEVIYEAGFTTGETLCFLDILVKKNGRWHAYEVKSSTGISDVYLWDAAVQYYVITETGLELDDFSIVYINNQYERVGELDLHELFIIEPVLDRIRPMQDDVKARIEEFRQMLQTPDIPEINIGPHCSDPYDCDFKGYCWQHVPEYSVFNISGLRGDKKWDLYNAGIFDIKDVPGDYPLNSGQRLQVESEQNGTVVIDEEKIRSFVSGLKYPLYFLDFESFQPAMPLFDHSKPYQQIVFQYSLHILKEPGAELEHKELLAEAGGDPRVPFIEQLIPDLGIVSDKAGGINDPGSSDGDILVYSQGFESTRLKEIARDFPKYEAAVEKMRIRIKDLMVPFQQKQYYKPGMRGSYSIKQVLPALVPGFSYQDLEIGDGGSASMAYEGLFSEMDMFKAQETRDNLLEYCKMDTMAMVEILKVLMEV